jgi:DNA repair photolyase
MLERRVPIHFGGISEPFADAVTTRVSMRLLEVFGSWDYPIVVSTKNPEPLAQDETLAVLRRFKHLVVQVSLTTPSAELAQRIEPNAPSPERRLYCLDTLSENGIHCVCRLQPLLLNEIGDVAKRLIPRLAQAGCQHVVVELLKLPVEKSISLIEALLHTLHWDAYALYKSNGASLVGREWMLPARFKWDSIQPIVEGIRTHGMTYGAGDYGLHHLGDTDCCCGLDGVEGFGDWFRGNLSNVIKNASSDRITLAELDRYWYPKSSIKRVLNSNCRLQGSHHGILDYLTSKWNSPGSANAPDQFLGVEWRGEYDERGNCVYARREIL